MAAMRFEWNNDGLKKFERQLKDQLSGDVKIPLEGSEDDAVRSVTQQLQGKGLTTNNAEVAKWVRDQRAAHRTDEE